MRNIFLKLVKHLPFCSLIDWFCEYLIDYSKETESTFDDHVAEFISDILHDLLNCHE